MKIRALAAALAVAAMTVLPVAAQAGTPAASMTAPVSYGAHATKSVKAKNNGAETFVLGGLALAAVVGGVIAATDDKS